ncbi:MAG: hypothetical protein QOH13_1440 [Thermoleophilaceae bacterium]|nr:hypothetical protein [Thermoleophilaceae bacterium]
MAKLATLQHGVVGRVQLVTLGLHPRAIDRRCDAGRLHAVHRGTYAVGHPLLSPQGRWMAGVLAGGHDAVLSHLSAAALWEIRGRQGPAEITVPVKGRSPRGVKARYAQLEPDEITVRAGIPVTTVERTLLDLGAVVRDPTQVEKAIREADYLGLFDLDEMLRLVERHPRRRGTAAMRKAVRAAADTRGRTRSELEERFLQLLSKAKLPSPEVNGTVELGALTIEADAVWRTHMLIAELDGRAAHGTADAFEADRLRDREAALAGWLVVRITWRQLRGDGPRVMDDLKRLLAQRG